MNDNVLIREYREITDWDDLSYLLQEGYASCVDKDILRQEYVRKEKNIVVAVDQSKKRTIGCFFWEIVIDYIRPRKIIYMTYLIVDKEYRRKGIATRLCEELDAIGRIHGCDAVEFTSANHRNEAHNFYKMTGYSIKKTSVFIKEL